jgi:KipI family sensor histidine kinase inhibitor
MTSDDAATWFGDRAILVHCADRAERARTARLLGEVFPSLTVRSGMRSVMVEAPRPDADLMDHVRTALAAPDDEAPTGAGRDRWVSIPTSYSGPDLEAVASDLGLGTVELVHAHASQVWRVAMVGFAPGFAYLVPEEPLTADWASITRRATPRPRVPSGSVAVAAGMSAVYPAEMPGGWHVIGRTELAVFDADRSHPALLAADDLVRFHAESP